MVNKKALATWIAFWSWKTQPFQLLTYIFNAVAANEICEPQTNFVVFLGAQSIQNIWGGTFEDFAKFNVKMGHIWVKS